MKTTIFSSLALGTLVTLFACQGPSGHNTNTEDSTGAIRQEPTSGAPADTRDTMAGRPEPGAQGAQGTVDDRSRTFMNEAAMGGMAEVQFGRLAQEKATNPRVKAFGEMMVQDHSAANDDLKSIARQKNVTLPDNLGKHQHHMDELNKKTGADF